MLCHFRRDLRHIPPSIDGTAIFAISDLILARHLLAWLRSLSSWDLLRLPPSPDGTLTHCVSSGPLSSLVWRHVGYISLSWRHRFPMYLAHANDNDICCASISAFAAESLPASSSSAHMNPSRGVSAETLSKVFRVDRETAARTIKVTSELSCPSTTTSLSQNFSTNDQMLRYRLLNSFFFTDTIYVTKKAKSKRGNLAMQLFVSDKGFFLYVPWNQRVNFLLHWSALRRK